MIITLLVFSYFAAKGLQDAIMASGKGFLWQKKYEWPFVSIDTLPKWYKVYHQMVGLKYKEKFFLSGSLLVSLSDWWHFVGLLRHSIVFSLCLYAFDLNVMLAALSYAMGLVVFNFTYVTFKSKLK